MTASKQRKPLRLGAFGNDGEFDALSLNFRPSFAQLRRVGGTLVRDKADRSLQVAARFYVSRRLHDVPVATFRRELDLLAKATDRLDRRLSLLSAFTRAEMYMDEDGHSGGLDGLEKYLRLARSRLAQLQEEEARSGRDFKDPAGSLLVREILKNYMTLTKRRKPPSISFDRNRDSIDSDDISRSEFGKFVVSIEQVICDGVKKSGVRNHLAYRLRHKRAAVRGAIHGWNSGSL